MSEVPHLGPGRRPLSGGRGGEHGKAEQAGGRIVMPKTAVPGVGWLSYAKDTEGNIFGMIENDPKAK